MICFHSLDHVFTQLCPGDLGLTGTSVTFEVRLFSDF